VIQGGKRIAADGIEFFLHAALHLRVVYQVQNGETFTNHL